MTMAVMKKKKKETLYSVLRPLIAAIYVVGWNFKKDLSKGLKVVKGYLTLTSVLYTCKFILGFGGSSSETDPNNQHAFDAPYQLMNAANIFCLFFTVARGRALDQLMDHLKTISVSSYAGSRLRVVKMTLLTLVVSCAVTAACLLASVLNTYCVKPSSALEAFVSVYISSLILLFFSAQLPLTLFAAFMALFIGCIAYFVKVSLEESLSELKQCRSIERRNRSMDKAIDRYYSLYRLARNVNRIGASLMFAVKATAALIASLSIYGIGSKVFGSYQGLGTATQITMTFLHFQYLAIYLWYLRVAPSANRLIDSVL